MNACPGQHSSPRSRIAAFGVWRLTMTKWHCKSYFILIHRRRLLTLLRKSISIQTMGRYSSLVVLLPWALVVMSSVGTTFVVSGETSVVTESAVRSLLDEAQEWLADSRASLEGDSLSVAIEEMHREIEGLKRLQQDLEQKEREFDRLVALANAKQVEGLMARLSDTLARETTLRRLTGQNQDTTVEVAAEDYVDRQKLEHQLDAKLLLDPSEHHISNWVLDVVEEELEKYQESVLNPTLERVDSATSSHCPAVSDVVQDVQIALTKFSQDVIGLIDHAQGAEIVHTMTSRTYVPPPTENELLGGVWWRKFIPEDWERLLPEGWEAWDVRIPSFFYHSLNSKRAMTSPPETILEKKVLPGACWPMDGNRGQVTIRLPYPIKVESFSLDHVPYSIIPEGMHGTAPKKLKVIAYPPCLEPGECGALGFDATDPMEVAKVEYDTEGPMVQTFNSIFVQPTTDDDDDDNDDNDESGAELGQDDEEKGASCSQEAAACSTPPKIDVAAITVKLLENHGNPDLTCIYRFRVHGEQVF